MSEWQDIRLEEIAEFKNGFAFKSSDFIEFGVPIIKIKNVKPNKINLDGLSYVKSELAESKQDYLIKPTDILITMSGNRSDGSPESWVGKVSLFRLKGDFLLNQRVSMIRAKEEKVDREFLAYNLSSWNTQVHLINQANSSGGQANISPEIVKNLEISLPSLKEQKAIASVLSSLDDKIDLLHRQNTTLERMAETLFRQWFVEEAQEGWEEVKLGDFVEINKKSINKAYPFNHIEYLDTGSLTEGKIESLQSYSINEAPSRALRLVENNDVLLSTVRPNQKHYGIINNPMENLVVSSGFCVLTCSKISPHFVYLLLTSNEMTEFLHSIAEGSTSTYPSLKPADIAAITFQFPPKDKLDNFSKIANDLWGKIHQNYKKIQTLEKLHDGLLPKLMSGEIRLG